MPELPEVETYARDLAGVLPGRRLTGARVGWPNQLPRNDAGEFSDDVAGQRIEGVSRRGKYLVFRLSRDWLLVHLKMSGRFAIAPRSAPADPHAHLVLALDGDEELRFHDPRKFGRAYLLADPACVLDAVGPEPLDPAFGVEALATRIAGRRGRLKPLLLDQRFLAGLGNIYTDESLWAARLHPVRPADSLDATDVARLHAAIRETLARAVEARGSSLSDAGYRDLTGNPGEMQDTLAVYGRQGEPCRRCGGTIVRTVVAGRGTHLCPACQELRR